MKPTEKVYCDFCIDENGEPVELDEGVCPACGDSYNNGDEKAEDD